MFDRQTLTRILCLVSLASWIVFFGLFGAFVISAIGGRAAGPGSVTDKLLYGAFYVGLVSAISRLALRFWPSCDQCQRQLFKEGRQRPFVPGERPWSRGPSYLPTDPERDYRAKTLMGSFATRAMVDAAIAGTACCQWCGHLDGQKPQYKATVAP